MLGCLKAQILKLKFNSLPGRISWESKFIFSPRFWDKSICVYRDFAKNMVVPTDMGLY